MTRAARRAIQCVDFGADARLELRAAWLPADEARSLEEHLRYSCEWEARSIVLFGRKVLQPRLVAWYGELPYRYSGQTLEPRTPPPEIADLMRRVSDVRDTPFNHVLLNRYRDGQDSMGRHSDDEAELGESPAVATLSLGASRRFDVYRAKARVWSAELAHGDLLLMLGRCQHELEHALPKQRPVTNERISLTFRRVLRPPGARPVR